MLEKKRGPNGDGNRYSKRAKNTHARLGQQVGTNMTENHSSYCIETLCRGENPPPHLCENMMTEEDMTNAIIAVKDRIKETSGYEDNLIAMNQSREQKEQHDLLTAMNQSREQTKREQTKREQKEQHDFLTAMNQSREQTKREQKEQHDLLTAMNQSREQTKHEQIKREQKEQHDLLTAMNQSREQTKREQTKREQKEQHDLLTAMNQSREQTKREQNEREQNEREQNEREQNEQRNLLTAMQQSREQKEQDDADKDKKVAMEAVKRCWRQQKSNYCGWHAVDVVLCVLGKGGITHDDFKTMMIPLHTSELDGVDLRLYSNVGYSIDALKNVLTKKGLAVETIFKKQGVDRPFDVHLASLMEDEPQAIIVGTGAHWIALVKKGKSWFDADSVPMHPSSHIHSFPEGIKSVVAYIHEKIPQGSEGAILKIHGLQT